MSCGGWSSNRRRRQRVRAASRQSVRTRAAARVCAHGICGTSRDERAELESIASSLRLSSALVPKLIAEADAARAAQLSANLGPLPADWALGEPLRVGDKVVFTGFDGRERERARMERRTQELGVRLLGNVSGLTAMLVSDGSFAGGKLARAQELGTRIVDPETYAILIEHLQPAKVAAPKPKRAAPTTTTAVAGSTPVTAQSSTSPGEIRAWGIGNGYAVGVRGRLSAELVQAYELALLDAQEAPAGSLGGRSAHPDLDYVTRPSARPAL